MEKLIETVLGVVVAVLVAGIIFIGANKWFDQTRDSWRRFGVITGAVVGVLFTFALIANRQLAWFPAGADGPDLSWLLVLVFGAAMAAWGWLITGITDRTPRIVVGAGGGALIGLIYGVFVRSDTFPAMQALHLVLWPVVGALVFAGIQYLRGHRDGLPITSLLTGATLGWLIGAFGVPELGGGTRAEAILGWVLLLGGLGLRIGYAERLPYEEREQLYRRSRAVIFLTPAVGFVGWSLVVPTLRTLWLSFQGNRGLELVGFKNYIDAFTDEGIIDFSGWTGIFSSSLLYWGIALAVIGISAGRYLGRRSNQPFEVGGSSLGPIALGVFLLAFAVFANLRGTIFNNLWWIFTVTIVVTCVGLAVAVLADRSGLESVAKSLIFMPMAISFVGAAIIWRFMYIARPPRDPQTGVLNAIWVWLGRVSNTGARFVAVAVLVAVLAGLAYVVWRAYRAEANALAIGSAVTGIPVLWLIYRFLGPGLGGFTINEAGELSPGIVIFLQHQPWNNIWIMVPFMWIYTGFAMVIFSAAIKAVPADLIEAAKVDGATESQVFWRVTVPQIFPTLGVVITTLIVVVAKVFDMVKVMTNGNFDTQVLANEMWQRAFTELNFGLGSALAVIIFVMVLPIMYYNIRTMQKEAQAT